MAFLMAKSLMKDEQTPSSLVPIGQQAYGAPEAYNMPDYRVTNLEPALMPGVGYANMAQPQQPIGMRQGGIASLSEGPGDITLAKLEPGEFVIRREAVDKVGLPALERINNMGRGRSG